MSANRSSWKARFYRFLYPPWPEDLSHLSPTQIAAFRAHQIFAALLRDLWAGGLTLRTTSLVYTTLLSLVPLLAFSFSVLQGFGVHNQLEPFLLRFLEPLGPERDRFVQRILAFVSNIEVGVLGAVGLGFLMVTVGSLIYKIETDFNFIWDIQEGRHWPRSLGGYLSVILGGPILLFTASGMASSVMGSRLGEVLATTEPFRSLLFLASELLPTLLVVAAATLMYRLIPNTQVSFSAALLGGAVAGVLWYGCGWIFGTFIGTSTRYTFIYSGFAIGLVFMIWLYVVWLILLVGGRIAFYFQNPHYMRYPDPESLLTSRLRELAGLTILCLIEEAFLRGKAPWTARQLEIRLALPRRPLNGLLADLEDAGLIVAIRGEPIAYLPAQEPVRITVKEALDALHDYRKREEWGEGFRIRPHPGAEAILDQVEKRLKRDFEEVTLTSFLNDEKPKSSLLEAILGTARWESERW